MPVQKYRSAQDMPRVGPAAQTDRAARIRGVWRRAFLLCPPSFHRGVIRFRSIDAANDQRLRATYERMRKLSVHS
jgi:hypothetical protein